jgi:hypothetical protein
MNSPMAKPIITWLMLLSRTLLFAVFQVLIAAALFFANSSAPWSSSAGWWTFSALFTNLVSIGLLAWLFHRAGKSFFNFISFSRQTVWKDIGLTCLLMLIFVPVSTFPGQWLANWLFGSQEIAFSLFFRPLPLWAGIISILYPISIAFAELPTYFGYVMPRLEKQLGNGWLAWGLVSTFLALQHTTLPLVLDGRFILWRFGMFVPLAFIMGLCLKIRPQLMPYFMVSHALLDMVTVVIILTL